MQGCIDITATQVKESAHGSTPLGPMAGAWDGYIEMAPAESMRAKALVGHIHAQAENCARAAIEIGKRLADLKGLLPHGQFMACVKAEFGWSDRWAQQLMQVAERFSNTNSSSVLPSSAKVLALLAASGADDTTVEQAAAERWTVAETKQRLRRAGLPRQPQPAEAMALSILRKGELGRLRAALALAERAAVVTPAEVMEEQRLRDIGKLRFIAGMEADFHRMKDGCWIRLPHSGDVDVTPEPMATPVQPLRQQLELQPIESTRGEVVSLDEAAERIGVKRTSLIQYLNPSRNPDGLIRTGYRITREGRGMVRLVPVDP
jgi:hypothetical protein